MRPGSPRAASRIALGVGERDRHRLLDEHVGAGSSAATACSRCSECGDETTTPSSAGRQELARPSSSRPRARTRAGTRRGPRRSCGRRRRARRPGWSRKNGQVVVGGPEPRPDHADPRAAHDELRREPPSMDARAARRSSLGSVAARRPAIARRPTARRPGRAARPAARRSRRGSARRSGRRATAGRRSCSRSRPRSLRSWYSFAVGR